MLSTLQKADEKYGKATEFQFLGFEYSESAHDKRDINICGIVLSTTQNYKLRIEVGPETKALEIVAFAYGFGG